MPTRPEGLPAYGFESLLELADMSTVTMLRRRRRELTPGQKPVGRFWTGHDWALLYRASQARDMPPMSPGRQRLYDANRTCAECRKKAVDPWAKGRDGRRYCSGCQGPVHERLWRQERQRDRPVVTRWAREVLDDPTTVLVACRARQYYREAYAVDLTGLVLLDARVWYTSDPEAIARISERHDGAGVVTWAATVEQLTALAARRPIAWSASTDLRYLARPLDEAGREVGPLHTEQADYFGNWYDRWVGELNGTSYIWHPSLKPQPAPWEPAEQVQEMLHLLTVMADRRGGTQ